MITNRHIIKLVSVIVAIAFIICLAAMVFSNQLIEVVGGTKESKTVAMEYETELFDTSEIISINVIIEPNDWTDLLENATKEEYYPCDVVVNGTTFYNVGIRTKGNTSLSAIANDPDTDRYSFKIEFDHYVDGQTCFGLDKIILNNNYADSTNRKEAIVYDMYQYLDTDASLYNYAKISLNGEYIGIYFALEAVEDSFLIRNYGSSNGALYKPDGMDNKKENKNSKVQIPENFNPEPKENLQELDQKQLENKEMGGGKGGFGMSGNGGDLNYTDDSIDSYSTIWDGAVTDTSDKDHKRVVEALKNISEGKDLETYMDIDNLLKYMAVHTFSVNLDSFSGNMAHNYYLYESNGTLNILPWDYNLAFGGFAMGQQKSASGTVNYPIDTPFSGTDFFDSLLENEIYRDQYHNYLQQLAEKYVMGGAFEAVNNRINSQIDSLVETDPTSLYSFEEYKDGVQMLADTIAMRAESILGQLKGEISSTEEEQQKNSSSLLDSSSIDLSVMGEMSMGGGKNFADRTETVSVADAFKENLEGFNQSEKPAAVSGSNRTGGRPSNMNFTGNTSSNSSIKNNLILYGVSLGFLLVTFGVVKDYRKKVKFRS